MISSIVLTGKYNIGINEAKKIKVGKDILSIDKDIPFVRYRFDAFNQEDIEYILKMKSKFNRCTHLVEIQVTNNVCEQLQLFNNIKNIAKFIYIDITDRDVEAGKLSDETIANIQKAFLFDIDRCMLKDKSVSLDRVTADKIIKQIVQATKQQKEKIGLCCSPFSFDGSQCLSSVIAREIMAKYSDVDDVALPTANHQSMNCCGCIRYVVVDRDTEVPENKKVASKKSTNESTGKPDVKKKTKNTTYQYNPNRWL